jgi:hypothetical protein
MSGFRAILDYLVIASLGLAALQVYLTTNKLWKRKHEPAVAESISIMGEFVGLIPVTFLTLKFMLDGQWEGAADGLIWVVGATVAVFIGTGRWVEGRRDRSFFRLLSDSVRQERGEVGHLAKSFLRPSVRATSCASSAAWLSWTTTSMTGRRHSWSRSPGAGASTSGGTACLPRQATTPWTSSR